MKRNTIIGALVLAAFAMGAGAMYHCALRRGGSDTFTAMDYVWERYEPDTLSCDKDGNCFFKCDGVTQRGNVYPLTLDNRDMLYVNYYDEREALPEGARDFCMIYTLTEYITAFIWKQTGKLFFIRPGYIWDAIKPFPHDFNGGICAAFRAVRLGDGYCINTRYGIGKDCITDMKRLLHRESFAMAVVSGTYAWDGMRKKKEYVISRNENPWNETHLVILCGWTQDGFIVCNSWGRGWGAKGFAIYPFDIFEKEFRHAVEITQKRK